MEKWKNGKMKEFDNLKMRQFENERMELSYNVERRILNPKHGTRNTEHETTNLSNPNQLINQSTN